MDFAARIPEMIPFHPVKLLIQGKALKAFSGPERSNL